MSEAGATHVRSAVIAVALWVGSSMDPASLAAACVGDCNGDGEVTVNELLVLVNITLDTAALTACPVGDQNSDGAITVNEIIGGVNNALGACPAPSGPLGVRRFTLNQARSPFQAALAPGVTFTVGGFQGQTNGQLEPGFLEFDAGTPDPATGVATIDITKASEFLVINGSPPANIVLCLKPVVPVQAAGVVACNGNFTFGVGLNQNHHIGQLGVDGFTAAACDAGDGVLESPNQICATGKVGEECRKNADCHTTADAGDGVCGLTTTTCTQGKAGACRADADCDIDPVAEDGVCGTPAPHPGVCNGPFQATQVPGDSGPGAMILAPNEQFNLDGLPVKLRIQSSLPCVDPGNVPTMPFALTSGVARGTIENFSNEEGQSLNYELRGENFSCADWQNPAGPGRLVLVAPALDQFQGGDIISGFTFSGH
jgi:hypothetical protein